MSITPPGGETDSIRWAMPTCSPIGGVTRSARADLPGDDLSGVQPDPQPKVDTVSVRHPSTRSTIAVWDLQGSPARAHRMVFEGHRGAEDGHHPVPGELVHGPAVATDHRRGSVEQAAMISRSRSAPTALAMSIEWTTSANKTVTCLYSAAGVTGLTGAPHLLQNSESGGSCVPQDAHDSPTVVSRPPGFTSIWFHRCLAVSIANVPALPAVVDRDRPDRSGMLSSLPLRRADPAGRCLKKAGAARAAATRQGAVAMATIGMPSTPLRRQRRDLRIVARRH